MAQSWGVEPTSVLTESLSGQRMTWQPWVTEVTVKGTTGGRLAQLDAELAARDADRGPEPDLIGPRPDGPLSGLQPLVIVG